MSRALDRRPRRIGLAWLVWLALLLALAQATATWHAFSHIGADSVPHRGDPHSPHTAPCDLCLVAAAIGGGALPTAAHALALHATREALPPDTVVGAWLSSPAPGYLSRAPPLSPR